MPTATTNEMTNDPSIAKKAIVPPPATPSNPLQLGVLGTLVAFSLALFTLPLGGYYYTLNNIFHGQTTYAAIVAVCIANLIVAAYVLLALYEVSQETKEEQKDKKE
ncbi:hypothetical protein DFS34DRAFT_645678 [Phlyctochytrium arcticum]|nr:hypothetical protein DFS34DRAFT_645678 [Phlyctochytrium arcticum]